MTPDFPLLAVDVGNTRMKFGLFAERGSSPLPVPGRTLELGSLDGDLEQLGPWLPAAAEAFSWWIGSVNRSATSRLLSWLRARDNPPRITLMASGDLPLAVALERPDMVGIDRLLNAVAANALRAADRSAIVIDLGTAITVDRVSVEGDFQGGAILPGIGLSARALFEFTDLLPQLEMASLGEPPAPLGTSTLHALRSGLYWGAVGGIRELIGRLSAEDRLPPQVFLSGGAAPTVAGLLAATAEFVPHLTLGGIALTAAR